MKELICALFLLMAGVPSWAQQNCAATFDPSIKVRDYEKLVRLSFGQSLRGAELLKLVSSPKLEITELSGKPFERELDVRHVALELKRFEYDSVSGQLFFEAIGKDLNRSTWGSPVYVKLKSEVDRAQLSRNIYDLQATGEFRGERFDIIEALRKMTKPRR
jgi:hypothetical protein